MPNWTTQQLNEYKARRLSSSAKPQPIIRHESVAEAAREECNAGQIVVSIKSYRRRLLDPDNLTGGAKYFIDGCRYAGLIPGDRQDQIKLEVSQQKVESKDLERTEIEIY